MYKIGVDLGGTNIAVGLTDENYSLICRHSIPTLAKRAPEEIIADICRAIRELLDQNNRALSECIGIGVGAPGTCDVEEGIVYCSYSLAWTNVRLAEPLQAAFSLPVHLDNDANCAALAEVRAGAAKGYRNAVLITIGTGIGTGIVLNGKIYSGRKGSGTELGHVTLNMDGVLCGCGRRGCWDAYSSATALIVQARRAAFNRPESVLNQLRVIDAKAVFDAADQGDIAACAVIEDYCRYLAVGISNVVNVFGPDIVLLGGGVSKQGERLLAPVREYIQKACFDNRPMALPQLRIASMGNDAGIVGAAALIE